MHHFRAFGGVLASELHFPELSPVAPSRHPGQSRPDWTIRVGAPGPFAAGTRHVKLLGAQRYPGDVDVRLLACGDRLRVETSDLGDFDVTLPRDIVWRPREGASEDWARFDLLGRVLPLVLHMTGCLVLHGSSAVLPDGRAVAFLAPKGHGKSTLALAIAQRGGLLLSDDVTVLEAAGERWLARPGVHAVRLWDDAVRGLGAGAYGELGAVGRKHVVQAMPEAMRAGAPAPLDAIYLLTGDTPQDGAVAARATLGLRAAALAIVRQATAGSLLGGVEGARLLERASGVARSVPVYALDVARDFARLDELVACVAGWSAGTAGRTGGPSAGAAGGVRG